MEETALKTARTITIAGQFEVNRLGYGTNRLTGPGQWGPPADPDAAAAVPRRAWELGVNLFDSAQAYGLGAAEEMVKHALHPYPEGMVILTKGGATRHGPNKWGVCGRPAYLRETIENSIRRLGVEAIDIYVLHGPDPATPLEDSVGALKAALDEGRIRSLGVSNVSVEQLERAMEIAPISVVENQYSFIQRRGWSGDSDQVLRKCEELGIPYVAWAPLGGSEHAARIAAAEDLPVLGEVARRHEAMPSQVALAWLLQSSPVTIAIPGTSRVENLESNIGALDIVLTDDEILALSAEGEAAQDPMSAPPAGDEVL